MIVLEYIEYIEYSVRKMSFKSIGNCYVEMVKKVEMKICETTECAEEYSVVPQLDSEHLTG